jgi:hypothetical protein
LAGSDKVGAIKSVGTYTGELAHSIVIGFGGGCGFLGFFSFLGCGGTFRGAGFLIRSDGALSLLELDALSKSISVSLFGIRPDSIDDSSDNPDPRIFLIENSGTAYPNEGDISRNGGITSTGIGLGAGIITGFRCSNISFICCTFASI